jgi:two-component system sensor histidine kinase UhpB
MLGVTAMQLRQPRARLSFLTRVFLVNAVVLTVITLLLLFSPITINAPVTENQAVILVVGFAVALLLNIVILRRVVRPLRSLVAVMRTVEPHEPGRRIVLPYASGEIDTLSRAFNEMLDRLEDERRESGRRALSAQEEERLRIARELHDEVGQALTGVMLRLEDEEAREAVRASLEEVRRIARELRPEALEDLGLQSALRSLCTATAMASGGSLWVERDLQVGDVEMTPEVELVLYRVAQESLTNVARHSGASGVLVSLLQVDGGVRLIVRDDGRGMPSEPGGPGSGIAGMRERALHVGGRLTIASQPGRGTEVRLDVPFPAGP